MISKVFHTFFFESRKIHMFFFAVFICDLYILRKKRKSSLLGLAKKKVLCFFLQIFQKLEFCTFSVRSAKSGSIVPNVASIFLIWANLKRSQIILSSLIHLFKVYLIYAFCVCVSPFSADVQSQLNFVANSAVLLIFPLIMVALARFLTLNAPNKPRGTVHF